MSKPIVIRVTEVALLIACLLPFSSNLRAQRGVLPSGSGIPWACRFLGTDDEKAEQNDPQEERNYSRSINRFYQLWCTSAPGSPGVRNEAANTMAESWKQLWYRDDPFNAAFHETGSLDLLATIAITRRLPKPMVDNPIFMRDWAEDCSDRCFMIYGDDDPGASKARLHMLQLRNYVLNHLRREPAAKPVLKMLKNAKLDTVN
jgi:hypothetical protein